MLDAVQPHSGTLRGPRTPGLRPLPGGRVADLTKRAQRIHVRRSGSPLAFPLRSVCLHLSLAKQADLVRLDPVESLFHRLRRQGCATGYRLVGRGRG